MPIKACADKLVREMEQFGYPPQFASEDDSPIDEKQKVRESNEKNKNELAQVRRNLALNRMKIQSDSSVMH